MIRKQPVTMIAARFARIPITAFVSGVPKQSFSNLRPGQRCVYSQLRTYASETRAARRARTRSLKEIAMAPAGTSGNMAFLCNIIIRQ